jgi:hypothetical protein
MLFKSVALNGAQENPPVTTAATGGQHLVDEAQAPSPAASRPSASSGNAAHIHDGAAGGTAASSSSWRRTSGTWTVPGGATLTPAQVDSYEAGTLYVNVHTTANPGGEIRGQIGRRVYFATLVAAQEMPPTTSTATSMGRWTYDPDTRTLAER